MGETPSPLYAELAERRARGTLDTSRLMAVQLDEYAGLAEDDERAFFRWLEREVLGPLAIPPAHTVRLRGDSVDLATECRRYDAKIARRGGLDLAVLGLGTNGHLGFNEPPSGADAPTREVALSEDTVAANARYWGGVEQVPHRAVTAGMRVLLRARRTLLLVTGEAKHEILRRTLDGEVGPDVPASYLRTIDGVSLHCDRSAWESRG